MKKKNSTKRMLSVILTLMILSSTLTIAVNAAIYNYNPSTAASYALKYAYSYNSNYTSYKGRGGDCANFVSQCLYNGGIAKTSSWKPNSTQWINCGGLKTFLCSTLGCSYISQPSASQISVGDVMYYNNGSHVCIVSSIENGVPKVCGHTTDTKNGSYKQGYTTYGVIKMAKKATHTVNTSYSKNFIAYPKAKITAANISDSNHCNVSSSAWIGTSDKCTIHEVYTDGCCKVTYPLDNGGTRTVYSKISLFNTAKNYYLDLNSYLNGSYRGNIYGIATADVYINGKRVANDVTDYYTAHPAGTTYKITDIRVKSGYKYNGRSSYSGTLNGNVNINLSFSTTVTYFTTNFSMKSGTYTYAYNSSSCSSKVGRIYPGDVIALKRIYSNGIAQIVCPWNDGNGSYNKTVYCKISDLKFKATHYIQAYSSINGSTCGRVYPNDLVTVCAVYSSGWMKAVCPWTNGVNKTIYIKCNSIY